MKRLSFLAVTAIVVTIGFSSCSNDDPAQPLNVDWNQTATVYGKVLIVDDFTNTPRKWTTADKVNIVATVAYSSLNPQASGTYQIPSDKITYTPSTGEVQVVAPVGRNGTQVNLKLLNFKGSVKLSGGTIDVIWQGSTRTVYDLYPGDVAYLSDNWELKSSYDYTPVANKGDEAN
ncbi:MAG: hypothetical protein LBF89_04830 [Bacteroidales bacterium]|jgi:hypothetical protein|nr:hypothetical protein [Bacteroidales bacterium]